MSNRVRLPSISFIVARSYPGNVIGYKNRLPWHLKSDLKRFRQITSGHAIILGRATFDSIGRVLPNRTNVVLSKNPRHANVEGLAIDEETNLYWTSTREDALHYADLVSIIRGKQDIFIVGGQTMYTLFHDLVNKVYLTQVFGQFDGDAFFDNTFPAPEWKALDELDVTKNDNGDDFSYRFSVYERRERRSRYERYEFVARFFTDNSNRDKWLQTKMKVSEERVDTYIQGNLDFTEPQ